MTAFVQDWLLAVALILAETGPYLIVGLALSGLIKAAISPEAVYRHLGRGDFRSVAKASLMGIPIPLCSCSVLPTAAALHKSGASKGATTSFLISTPETGVDSISVTWALMDPLMTLWRPLAALITALGAGSLVNLLTRRGGDQPPRAWCGEKEVAAAGTACGDRACCSADDGVAPRPRRVTLMMRGLREAFGPLLDDLTPWFVLGFALSGLVTVLVPDGFFREFLPPGWYSLLAMLVVGLPLYTCATSSTPIAAAMVAKGLDPGAALVFLLVGPATNAATMAVVGGTMGTRVLAIYLVSIALSALFMGWTLNWVYDAFAITPVVQIGTAAGHLPGPVAIVGGVCLAGLLALSAWRIRLGSRLLGRVTLRRK